MGDLLEHGGLAGLGGRDDEAALSEADGGEEVDHAGGDLAGGGLENDLALGEDGCEVLEDGAVAVLELVGAGAVDPLDAHQAEVALALLGGADLAGDGVAVAEAEAADLGLGDIDVARGAVAGGDLAQEAVAFVHGLEDAGGDEGLLGGGQLEQAAQQVLAVQLHQGLGVGKADIAGQGEELLLGLGAKLRDIHDSLSSRHDHLCWVTGVTFHAEGAENAQRPQRFLGYWDI